MPENMPTAPPTRIMCNRCRRIVVNNEVASDGVRCWQCAGEPRPVPGIAPTAGIAPNATGQVVIVPRRVANQEPFKVDWGSRQSGPQAAPQPAPSQPARRSAVRRKR